MDEDTYNKISYYLLCNNTNYRRELLFAATPKNTQNI